MANMTSLADVNAINNTYGALRRAERYKALEALALKSQIENGLGGMQQPGISNDLFNTGTVNTEQPVAQALPPELPAPGTPAAPQPGFFTPRDDSLRITNMLRTGAEGALNIAGKPMEMFGDAVGSLARGTRDLFSTEGEIKAREIAAAEKTRETNQGDFAKVIGEYAKRAQGGNAGGVVDMGAAINPTEGFDVIRQHMEASRPEPFQGSSQDDIDQSVLRGLGGGLAQLSGTESAGQILLAMGLGAYDGKDKVKTEDKKEKKEVGKETRAWHQDMAGTELTLQRIKDQRSEQNRVKIHDTTSGTMIEQTIDGKRVLRPFQATGYQQASLQGKIANALFPGGKAQIFGQKLAVDPNEPLGIEQSLLAQLDSAGKLTEFASPILQNPTVKETMLQKKSALMAAGLDEKAINDQMTKETILLLASALNGDEKLTQMALDSINQSGQAMDNMQNNMAGGFLKALNPNEQATEGDIVMPNKVKKGE